MIQMMGWADLREMWDKIQKGNATGWDSGKAFEYLVHWTVTATGGPRP